MGYDVSVDGAERRQGTQHQSKRERKGLELPFFSVRTTKEGQI